MSTPAIPWNGNPLGPGPIALLLPPAPVPGDSGDGLAVVVASPASAAPVPIALERMGGFLHCHTGELFVALDVAAIHQQLMQACENRGDQSARDALWALTRYGRWVDLRLLDRQVRYALGDNDFRLHDWSEIAARWLLACTDPPSRRDRNRAFGDAITGQSDQCSRMLAVYHRLRTEADRLMAEAAPVSPPDYEVRPLPPDEAEAVRARYEARVRQILEHRQRLGLRQPPATVTDQYQGEAPLPRTSVPLGQQVEIWAAVALDYHQLPGLVVDHRNLPALLSRAEEEYRRASAVLFRITDVRSCFQWSGEVVSRNAKGYPVTRPERLAAWLRKACDALCDDQNQTADVPRNADGRPSSNPEEWGFWVACNDALWAWREVFRLAEVARIAGAEAIIRPRYATLPRLRSREPNLAAYRSLGIPVFRPRDGCVYVAGELLQLQARCLAAVCLQRCHVSRGQARLYHYVLREGNPLAVAAGELYAHDAAARGAASDVAGTATGFCSLRATDPDRYYDWLWLTNALLESIPLGLPGSFLTALLGNDYGLQDLNEQDVLRLEGILTRQIAYELGSFLGDATLDMVTARLGLTANEGLQQFVDVEHPRTAGSALRNDLQRRRRRRPVARLLIQGGGQVGSDSPTFNPLRNRKELFQYRSTSLAGRVTHRAASATVRREEVLMTVDEVMLAVAHDVRAAGYQLLGVAGNEFVLEVPTTNAGREQLVTIGQIAQDASKRILGEMLPSVLLDVVEAW